MRIRNWFSRLAIATFVIVSSANCVSAKTVNGWNGKSDNERIVQGVAGPTPQKVSRITKAKAHRPSKPSTGGQQPPPLHDPN